MNQWLEEVLRIVCGTWIISLIFGTPFTYVHMLAIMLGIPVYRFIRPLVTVLYKNYRKEIYHGPHQDR